MSLRLRDIEFAYRIGEPILRSIEAEAPASEITAIIGPNAAGKTTLLRVVAGLLDPQSGSVLFNDLDLHALDSRVRSRQVAYVAQRPTVDAPFTVRDILDLGTYPHIEKHAGPVIDEAIDRCDLGRLVHTRFHELSVGQQQRVSLARAFVQLRGGGTDCLLLLDEPMSAMDPKHINRAGSLLRSMANGGTTIVIVLHDLPLSGALADRVWAMQAGRIMASGTNRSTLTAEILGSLYETRFVATGSESAAAVRPNYDFTAEAGETD